MMRTAMVIGLVCLSAVLMLNVDTAISGGGETCGTINVGCVNFFQKKCGKVQVDAKYGFMEVQCIPVDGALRIAESLCNSNYSDCCKGKCLPDFTTWQQWIVKSLLGITDGL